MNGYRVTVTYEFEIDAPDWDMARQWAVEEVENGRVIVADIDMERMDRPARPFVYPERLPASGREGSDAA